MKKQTMNRDWIATARTLSEALPYLQRYDNSIVVIKLGGHAMGSDEAMDEFARDVVLMQMVGVNPVIVHGGGPMINAMLDKLEIQSDFVNGKRVTDEATVEVVEMVLSGVVNKKIVQAINRQGGKAVGLSGKDANLMICDPANRELGFVGEPSEMNPKLVQNLCANDIIPVANLGLLKFIADQDAFGTGWATFDFEVFDGTDFAAARQTMTIDVTAVNDPPVTADNTVTATEDTVFTFASGDFPYTDVESDPINKVRLQAVTAGTLWVDTDSSGALDGAEVAVANNDEVAAADFTKLSFLADPDDNGVAYATFLFEVNDATDYSTQHTMTIDVTAVNDAPTSADNTVTAIEDTVFTFAAGDFPYTDMDGDGLQAIRLQAVTTDNLWIDADDGVLSLDTGTYSLDIQFPEQGRRYDFSYPGDDPVVSLRIRDTKAENRNVSTFGLLAFLGVTIGLTRFLSSRKKD